MAVRKITNIGGMKRVSKFPSVKLNKIVRCESPLERDYAYLLEHSNVKFYEEQPLRIHYYLDGKRCRYTPDFLVVRHNRRQIVEVKPESKVIKDEYQTLFRIVCQICCQEGYEFVVVTDKMIRVQPRLDNIKLLYRYAKVPIFLHHQLACYKFFKEQNAVCIKSLATFLTSMNVENPLPVVYALIYGGFVEFDLMNPISVNSIVGMPKVS